MEQTNNTVDLSKGHTCFQIRINDRWHLSCMTCDRYARMYEILLVDTMGRQDTRYIKDTRKFYENFTAEGRSSNFYVSKLDEIPNLIKQAKKYIKKKFNEDV